MSDRRPLRCLSAWLLLLILVLALTPGCKPPPANEEIEEPQTIEITHIANAGFLITSGHHKVLIDAVFGPAADDGAWETYPPAELLESMVQGEPPFAGIDVILVTHNHRDHFQATIVLELLEQQPLVRLVATEQTMAQLQSSDRYVAVADRVSYLPLAESRQISLGGITVTAIPTRHSFADPARNNMYLVDLEGARIFHEGDAERDPAVLSSLGLGQQQIDIAFLHPWRVLQPDGRDGTIKHLAPSRIVVMHVGTELAAAIQEQLARPAGQDDQLPPVTLLEPMQRKVFPIR